MIVVKNYHNSGFSLIELVAVIVLLGILGIAALGRFSGQEVFAARGFFDDTVGAVRFAQKYAVSSGCNVRVATSTPGGYQLLQNSTCYADDYAAPVANPADRGSNYQRGPVPDGYTLTAGQITFNWLGQRLEATSNFTLTDGSNTFTFTVHADSGLVEVL